MLDGYLTLDVCGWHFHLWIGEHGGAPFGAGPPSPNRSSRAVLPAWASRVGGALVQRSDEQPITVWLTDCPRSRR
jgi:hypothetical protein